MNKEVIKANKEAFDYWLDGGEVYVKATDCQGKFAEWHTNIYPSWEGNYIYVQNDEYVEFRKALADGKTIEYMTNRSGKIFANWETMRQIDYFNRGVQYYRIKPDEPAFKVGDWVRDDSHTLQITESMIKDTSRARSGWFERVKLWTPQDSDVVICNDQPTPRIYEVNSTNLAFTKSEFSKKRVIPYIGQPFEDMKC